MCMECAQANTEPRSVLPGVRGCLLVLFISLLCTGVLALTSVAPNTVEGPACMRQANQRIGLPFGRPAP